MTLIDRSAPGQRQALQSTSPDPIIPYFKWINSNNFLLAALKRDQSTSLQHILVQHSADQAIPGECLAKQFRGAVLAAATCQLSSFTERITEGKIQ